MPAFPHIQKHRDNDMRTCMDTHTHTASPVLLPPACCWNCFPPSSEPGKADFIVLTYLCVKSDCRVLYLCLYSDGEKAEKERERARDTERLREWRRGGCSEARRATGVRRMVSHFAPLWRIMTGCLAITHPHPFLDFHPEQSLFFSSRTFHIRPQLANVSI